MYVPVVAAARLEGNICQEYRAFTRFCQRIKIGISDEILSVGSICIPKAEYIFLIKLFFIIDTHVVILLLYI